MIKLMLGVVGQDHANFRHRQFATRNVHHFAGDREHRLAVLEILFISNADERDAAHIHRHAQGGVQ